MGIRYSFEIFGFASFKSGIFVISVTIKSHFVKPQLVKSHLGLNGSAPTVENSAEILVNMQAFLG